MSGFRPTFLFVLIASLSLFAGGVPAHAQRKAVHRMAPAPLPPQPAPVPTPLTLEQMPVTPPQISYRNGQLTIISQNSTLGDILTAVRTHTGASVDIPPNATERVVSHLGPGPAREVLASLLNGSHFNYVLLGSPSDPTVLDRVILISKSSSSSEISQPQPDNSAQMSQPMPVRTAAPAPLPEDEDLANDDLSMDEATDNEGQADFANDAAADPSQPPAQPKTPEQLLQQLQRQQQGLQQQPQPGGPQGFPVPGQFPQPQQPQPPQ